MGNTFPRCYRDCYSRTKSYIIENEGSLLDLIQFRSVKESRVVHAFYCLGLRVDETDPLVRPWIRVKIDRTRPDIRSARSFCISSPFIQTTGLYL